MQNLENHINKILYYLGSEEDVLDRLQNAAEFYNLDFFLSITGENPFFSIDYANKVVNELKRNRWDFIYPGNLPMGCAVYGLKNKALKVVCKVKKEIDTEIWGPLINRPEIFKVGNLNIEEFYNRPSLRLTTDYPEDYEFIKKIYSHFTKDEIPTLFDVLNILDKNPEYLKINSNRKQAGLSDNELKRIDAFYIENHSKIVKLKEEIFND